MSYKEQAQAKLHLTAMMYGDSRQEALKERKKFERAFRHNPKALKTVVENWDRLTTYYDFPREHWKHLRTSNLVQSRFSRVRLRTTASRRLKSQINATSLIWKTLMVAEMSFRKLNAPNLVEKVAEGGQVIVDQAAMLGGEKWFRSSGWRAGPTVFSAPTEKPEISPTFSRPTMAGIEHRHAAVGFFPLLTDYPA